MTLTELLPVVQDLPAVDKLTLFHVLAEQLNSKEDISPLTPGKVYYIATPYDMYGAGDALLNVLKQGE
jgi:hypothetical protein